MKYFQKIAENLNLFSIHHGIVRQSHLWNQNTRRTKFEGTPHAEVDDIWIRFNEDLGQRDKDFGDDLEAIWYPAINNLPEVRPLVRDLMARVEGTRLGRVLITKLAPGKRILPHSDVLGEYSRYYDRYHVVIQGMSGSLFRVEDETVCMKTGECWWFNANKEHEVINNSVDDRIHLMVDICVSPRTI